MNYSTLVGRVGDAVLMNNVTKFDEFWYNGLVTQPLLEKKLEELNEEEGNTDEPLSVLDLASEVYQTYVITQRGAEFLFNHTAEIISYNETLDVWLWHVTHFGTSWSMVYTDVYWPETDEERAACVYGHEELMKYIHG